MGNRKLNYRIHNPNSPEDTAEFLCKLFVEVNADKVERAIKEAALGCEKNGEYIKGAEEVVSVGRRRAR